MQHLDVRIQRNDDPPAFPEMIKKKPYQAELGPIAVIEDGTAGGQIAVGFFFHTPNGAVAFCQITETNLTNLAGIVRGLRQRINDEKTGQLDSPDGGR